MKTKYFKLAKSLSYTSDYEQHKLACIITKKNRIISLGVNKRRTHPKSLTRYNFIHAELAAVLGVSRETLKGTTAYVYRERKDGTIASSKPCPHCEQVLREAGIKKVYYTTENGYGEMKL